MLDTNETSVRVMSNKNLMLDWPPMQCLSGAKCNPIETTHYSWKIDRNLIRVIVELGASRLDFVSFNDVIICKGLE